MKYQHACIYHRRHTENSNKKAQKLVNERTRKTSCKPAMKAAEINAVVAVC